MNCAGKPWICPPTGHDPHTALPGTLLCGDCTRRLEQHLAELPARLHLVQALHDGKQTPRRTDRPGGDAPVPITVDAHDLLTHAPAILHSWTRLVCERRNLRGPDTPERLAPWLLGQLDWLVTQPWADDLADEIRDLTRAAERLARVNPHRIRLEPPCPSCQARELGRWDGTDQVDCNRCGRAWPRRDYPWMVRVALDDSRGCLTATEAAQRLGITVPGFRAHYVSAGRVRKLGTVDGTARYSAGDVDALTSEEGAA